MMNLKFPLKLSVMTDNKFGCLKFSSEMIYVIERDSE